jgi:predicted component of type VI protein secretion system
MHYAYEAMGAVYNSGEDVIAQTPWVSLVDDADYNAKWGLNVIPDNATFVKTLKYNGVDREVWQMKHPNKNSQIWVVAEYASDGTKIWDDTLVVKRGGMWYMNGLGDLTNRNMRDIVCDGRPICASYSGSMNTGRTTQQVDANINFDVAINFFRNNKNVESLRCGYINSINNDNIMLDTTIRYIVGQHNGTKVPTLYLYKNLTLATLRYIQFTARANFTLSCELVSARSVIFALNNTTNTITITFPSTLYDRLMDTSTTLGAELVALLESKSNITFARGE